MILPKVRDPRLVTIRRGGTLSDQRDTRGRPTEPQNPHQAQHGRETYLVTP